MDPDTLDSQQPARDEVTGEMVGKVYKESRVPPPAADRTGLKAAQTALELLRSTSDPPAALLTETLIELGDWYQATSRPADLDPLLRRGRRDLRRTGGGGPARGPPAESPAHGVLPAAAVGEPRAQHALGAVRHPQDRLQLPRVGEGRAARHHGRLDGHGRGPGLAVAARGRAGDLQPALRRRPAGVDGGRHLHQRVVPGIRPGNGAPERDADLHDPRATAAEPAPEKKPTSGSGS